MTRQTKDLRLQEGNKSFFNCVQLVLTTRKMIRKKTTNIKEIRIDYELNFCGKVQDYVIMRKNLRVTQFDMSCEIGVSLRTIQNFESYKCMDYFILYAYKRILNELS